MVVRISSHDVSNSRGKETRFIFWSFAVICPDHFQYHSSGAQDISPCGSFISRVQPGHFPGISCNQPDHSACHFPGEYWVSFNFRVMIHHPAIYHVHSGRSPPEHGPGEWVITGSGCFAALGALRGSAWRAQHQFGLLPCGTGARLWGLKFFSGFFLLPCGATRG